MDGMLIPWEDRIYYLVESLVWKMSIEDLRDEMIGRLIPEYTAKPPHELLPLFEENNIGERVGDNAP